jgi:hypothetical protein
VRCAEARGYPLRLAGLGSRRYRRDRDREPRPPRLGEPHAGLHGHARPPCGPGRRLGVPPADGDARHLRRPALRPLPPGQPARQGHGHLCHVPAGTSAPRRTGPRTRGPDCRPVRDRRVRRGTARRPCPGQPHGRAVPRCRAAQPVDPGRNRLVPRHLGRGRHRGAPLRSPCPRPRCSAAGALGLLPPGAAGRRPPLARDPRVRTVRPADRRRMGARPAGKRRGRPGRCRGARAGRRRPQRPAGGAAQRSCPPHAARAPVRLHRAYGRADERVRRRRDPAGRHDVRRGQGGGPAAGAAGCDARPRPGEPAARAGARRGRRVWPPAAGTGRGSPGGAGPGRFAGARPSDEWDQAFAVALASIDLKLPGDHLSALAHQEAGCR